MTACRNTAGYCITFLTVWNSRLRQQISKIPSLSKVSLSFRWKDEGKEDVKTKAECFKATIFISIIIPFTYALLTKREVNMTGYMAKFLFLVGYATRLRRSLGRYATSCIRGTQRECSSKPLKHRIVKRILVFLNMPISTV